MSRACKINAKRKITDDIEQLGCNGRRSSDDDASDGGSFRQCVSAWSVKSLSETARGIDRDVPSMLDLLPTPLFTVLTHFLAGASYDAAAALPFIQFLWESPAPQRRERCHTLCLDLIQDWTLEKNREMKPKPKEKKCSTAVAARRRLLRSLSDRKFWYCHLCGTGSNAHWRVCSCVVSMLADLPANADMVTDGPFLDVYKSVMDPVIERERDAMRRFDRLPHERRRWYHHYLRFAAAECGTLGLYLDRWNEALRSEGVLLKKKRKLERVRDYL